MPRILVTCGHAFCEGGLSCMLRCAPPIIFGDCQPPKLQAVRSSAEQAIEESLAVDDKCEDMQLCDWVLGLAVQAAAGERGWEAAGVPEVPRALHREERRRAHAARGLRHSRRLSGAPRFRAIFRLDRDGEYCSLFAG